MNRRVAKASIGAGLLLALGPIVLLAVLARGHSIKPRRGHSKMSNVRKKCCSNGTLDNLRRIKHTSTDRPAVSLQRLERSSRTSMAIHDSFYRKRRRRYGVACGFVRFGRLGSPFFRFFSRRRAVWRCFGEHCDISRRRDRGGHRRHLPLRLVLECSRASFWRHAEESFAFVQLRHRICETLGVW